MTSPFKLTKYPQFQFLHLFVNADAFYISARRALLYGWINVGCSNAHQSIELYIKAILSLNDEAKRGHDLVDLLKTYESRDQYFTAILEEAPKVEFLEELSDSYLSQRYGEAVSDADSVGIIRLLDELTFNLRHIYLRNLNAPSTKIYIPAELKAEFLSSNEYFTEQYLTNDPFAQISLPSD